MLVYAIPPPANVLADALVRLIVPVPVTVNPVDAASHAVVEPVAILHVPLMITARVAL
jgi:hypothetical protein